MKKTTQIICNYCNTPFVARRNDAKFCSGACKQQAYLINAAERYKLYLEERQKQDELEILQWRKYQESRLKHD